MKTVLLRTFFICMGICAVTMLVVVWYPTKQAPERFFEVALTAFIIGLASFLVWFTTVVREIARNLGEKDHS